MPALGSAFIASDLSEWMEGLVIPIPPGTSFELPAVGNLIIEQGECRGLSVGQVDPIDNSSGLDLELGLWVRGVDVSCSLSGHQNGTLTIDIDLVNSTFGVAVKVAPWYPAQTPETPLPMGGLSMSMCSLDLQVNHTQFSGTAEVVQLASSLPDETLRSLMAQFVQEPVCNKVRHMIDTNGTDAFSEGRDVLAPMLLAPAALPEPHVLVPTVDLSNYPPVEVIKALVNTQFPKWAGRYLQVMHARFKQKLFGNENVSLSMQGFDIVGKGPQQRPGLTIVSNGTELGLVADLMALEFSTVLGIDVTMDGLPGFSKAIKVSWGLNSTDIGANIYLNQAQFEYQSTEFNLGTLNCYVDCMRSATDPADASFAVTHMFTDLEQGTRIEVAGDTCPLEATATHTVNSIIAALQGSYMPGISALINGGLGMVRPLVSEAFWDWADSKPPCGDTKQNGIGIEESTLTALWATCLALLGLAILVGLFAPFSRRVRSWKPRHSLKAAVEKRIASNRNIAAVTNMGTNEVMEAPSLSNVATADPAEVHGTFESEVSQATSEASSLAGTDVCLGLQPQVPMWVTVSFPLALLSICFLFLYADLAMGAIVNVRMIAGGDEEVLGPVFAFSLINTIAHSWKAGAYLIAILTFLMSGLWPFVKLCALFVSWVAPPRLLSAEDRGRVLGVLDVCGKYSFLDSWFLVLSVSAFALHWSGNDAQMKVEVMPTSAFYCFVLATALSLVLGHVASEFHRYGLRQEKRGLLALQKGKVCDRAHEWNMAVPLSHFVSRPARLSMSFLIVFAFVISLVAAFTNSFQFMFGGLVSQVLEVANWKYSLVSVATWLPESGGGRGLVLIMVLFLVLTLVLPLLLLSVLLVLWLVPLPGRVQDFLIYAVHVLDCWASMDVAALTLTIEAWELGHLTEFLVSSNGLRKPCEIIKDITRTQCFEVSVDLHFGFVLLLIAGVALLVVPKVAHHLCTKALEQRNVCREEGSAKGKESYDDAIGGVEVATVLP